MNLIVAWVVLVMGLGIFWVVLYFGVPAYPSAAIRAKLLRGVLLESRPTDGITKTTTTNELMALPPDLTKLPSEDQARANADKSLRAHACFIIVYIPFRILGGFVQAFSTICLILRSFRQNKEVARAVANQLDKIFAAMSFLGPVARVAEIVVRWFYNALDLSHLIDKFIVNIDVLCRGAQQPWYLLANLAIFAFIVVLTSADVLDPLCFRQIWRTLIVERKEYKVPAPRPSRHPSLLVSEHAPSPNANARARVCAL